jgi:hypothetical protein
MRLVHITNGVILWCIKVDMEERLFKLETQVEAIARSLERLEARVHALETHPPFDSEDFVSSVRVERKSEPVAEAAVPENGRSVPILSLVGQICLVLCGAFLLRTLTELNVLPTPLGLTVGPVYALGWLFFADFRARSGKRLGATFYGTSSIAIVYPLLWEATTTFGVMGGLGSAVALAVVTASALGVAWRRDLPVFAWAVTIAAIGTTFVLVVTTHRMVPFAAVLMLLGVGTFWMTYSRGWRSLWWLPAIAADLLVFHMVYLATRPPTSPEYYTDLSVLAIRTLGLCLFFVYLVSFAIPTLLRKREVSVFEIVQTATVLFVGFGGAVYVAEASPISSIVLGAAALVPGLASYVVAFAFTELHWGARQNHVFYAWLALILTLGGSYVVTGGVPVLLAWCALSVAATVLGARYLRPVLYYHSAAFAVAAALLSTQVHGGLITLAVEVFTSPADQPWSPITVPDLVITGAAVISFAVIALSKTDLEHPRRTQIPRLVLALLAALGGAAVVLDVMLVHIMGSPPPEAEAAVVAAVRTGVIAGMAVALAVVSRLTACFELRWLVYSTFIVASVKLFLEDLPQGQPTTQFLAFALYGIALILAPRLIHSVPHHGKTAPQLQEG